MTGFVLPLGRTLSTVWNSLQNCWKSVNAVTHTAVTQCPTDGSAVVGRGCGEHHS